MGGPSTSIHNHAADAFARRIREQYGDAIESVFLFGSAARGEERGSDSDVDLLVVLYDTVEKAVVEDRIRALAYDIELEYGVILSVLVTSPAECKQYRMESFFQQISTDAQRLYG